MRLQRLCSTVLVLGYLQTLFVEISEQLVGASDTCFRLNLDQNLGPKVRKRLHPISNPRFVLEMVYILGTSLGS